MSKKDWFIVCGALLAAGLLFLVFRLVQPEPQYVTVYVGSQVFARVEVGDYQTIVVDQGDGKVNVVKISPEGVRMESSTCKNQLCVEQGLIHPEKAEELLLSNWIVCLPNGVTVEISGGEDVSR